MEIYFDLWNASVVLEYSVTEFFINWNYGGGIKKTFVVIECVTAKK